MNVVERIEEATASPLELLNGKTRTSVAVHELGKEKEGCDYLNMEVGRAFLRMYKAVEQALANGMEVEVTFGEPLQVAWDAWRRDKERREAVREDMAARGQ